MNRPSVLAEHMNVAGSVTCFPSRICSDMSTLPVIRGRLPGEFTRQKMRRQLRRHSLRGGGRGMSGLLSSLISHSGGVLSVSVGNSVSISRPDEPETVCPSGLTSSSSVFGF